jgi:hypothetical protein
MKKTLRAFLVVVLVAAGAWVIFTLLGILSASDSDQRDRDELRQEVATVKAANSVLEQQLRDLGETPRVEVPSPTTPNGVQPQYVPVQGERGPGPSFSQVLSAVRLEVPAALSSACGGSCKGAKGDSVTGPPGESVTGPPGETGPAGRDGSDGNPGRGIVSGPECDGDGNLVTHYDQEPFVESHPAPACQPTVPTP